MNTTDLAQDREILKGVITQAHTSAAVANKHSISTHIFLNAYRGSGDVVKAIAAAMLSTGDIHAPLVETRKSIEYYIKAGVPVPYLIGGTTRYPGLGNSFFKECIDPSFALAYNKYCAFCDKHKIKNALAGYTVWCNYELRKDLFPNAAGITAAICIAIGARPLEEVSIFVTGRTRGWLSLI